MQALDALKTILIVIGGLNWGLVGFFEYNLVDSLFGEGSWLARTVYAIVGLAAVWALVSLLAKTADKAE